MDALVTNEMRYDRTPDGKVWTPDQGDYTFFTRYLAVFDRIEVLARVRPVEQVPDDYLRVDGDNISVIEVPFYHGLSQYARRYFAVNGAIREAVQFDKAVILRLASPIGSIVGDIVRAKNFPYAVEVMSDPLSTFAPGAVKHPLRPLIKTAFVRTLRKNTSSAVAASYVTNHFLQERYPCPSYSVGISDVELDAGMFVDAPHVYERKEQHRLSFVGSLSMMYKAPDIMVQAVRQVRDKGYDISLDLIGEGKHRPEVEAMARELGVADCVKFWGRLPGHRAVAEVLDNSDVFVLPSRTEGQPRALQEAMARGLACIGTTAGGMPELLPPEDMVTPGDADALANKIIEFISNPARMTEAAARNLAVAREYEIEALDAKRHAFYSYVAEQTESHINKGV